MATSKQCRICDEIYRSRWDLLFMRVYHMCVCCIEERSMQILENKIDLVDDKLRILTKDDGLKVKTK